MRPSSPSALVGTGFNYVADVKVKQTVAVSALLREVVLVQGTNYVGLAGHCRLEHRDILGISHGNRQGLVGDYRLRHVLQELHVIVNLFLAKPEERLKAGVAKHAREFDEVCAADEQCPLASTASNERRTRPLRVFVRPDQNVDVTQYSHRTGR